MQIPDLLPLLRQNSQRQYRCISANNGSFVLCVHRQKVDPVRIAVCQHLNIGYL